MLFWQIPILEDKQRSGRSASEAGRAFEEQGQCTWVNRIPILTEEMQTSF